MTLPVFVQMNSVVFACYIMSVLLTFIIILKKFHTADGTKFYRINTMFLSQPEWIHLHLLCLVVSCHMEQHTLCDLLKQLRNGEFASVLLVASNMAELLSCKNEIIYRNVS